MRDFDTKSMLIVPDKQMKDFMFVMNLDPAAVILNDDCFAVGTKVQVIKEIFVELKVNWPVFLIVLMSLSVFVAFYLPVSRFLKATLHSRTVISNILSYKMNTLMTQIHELQHVAHELLYLGADGSPIYADSFRQLNTEVLQNLMLCLL